tara:strand:+ start:308 stop:487 length:180 start_codon:yes stop_codon:yes gene_type:complete
MHKDLQLIEALRKELLKRKETAPIRYKKVKEEMDVIFEPEPNITLAVDNTKIKYKKGLI